MVYILLYAFDLVGKFAHWKKFDTNSSSLTYFFPSKTNLIGLFSSILEIERDSYYDKFLNSDFKVAIILNNAIRKKMTVLNYLHSENSIKNNRIRTQIKLELLMPTNFKSEISYKIVISSLDTPLYKSLKNKIENNEQGFGIYLGQRQFRGNIENFKELSIDNFIKEKSKKISSVFNSTDLGSTWGKKLDFSESILSIEDMPYEFNNERELKSMVNLVCNPKAEDIEIKEEIDTYLIDFGNVKKNILFI